MKAKGLRFVYDDLKDGIQKSLYNGVFWEEKEHRNKISKRMEGNKYALGSIRKLVVCPYCNKEGANGAMQRWHFNNCKAKND